MQWGKNKNMVRGITLTLVISFALIAGLLFKPNTQEVSAGDPAFIGGVTVNSPKPPAVREYNPGEAMVFSADFKWAYCNNEGNGVTYGRMTRPVLISQPHTALSPKKLIGTRLFAQTPTNIATALRNAEDRATTIGRGVEFIDGIPKFQFLQSLQQAFARWRRREGVYVERFTAPMRPGLYHFLYELEIGSAGDNLIQRGRVVFKVRDRAQCPGGLAPIPGPGGGTQCPTPGLPVSCTSSATQIDPGGTVTFRATSSSRVTFTWYNGTSASGAVIGGPEVGTASSINRTFVNAGQYQVTVIGRNTTGQYGICTKRINVGDVQPDDETNNVNEDANLTGITTESGEFIPFNPNAGPASIRFELDRSLTNTTCGGTWEATNVLSCSMVKNNDTAGATVIPMTGTDQLPPGTYYVKCLAARDGQPISSEIRGCYKNPDVREN